ncbi:VanZ family protein [Hyphomonas sp.]|jgi:VanZ family protein|uniref:VanZ family protein n=1 Tax=Hyphomonas sp. TaxID=87 RepID=UPI0039E3DF19
MNILSGLNTVLARRLAGLASLLVAAAIAILSILPGEDLPEVHLSDKVEHAIAYAALSACICFWLGRRRIIAGVLVTVGFGAVLEIVQALAGTGRTASLLDEGANLVGACLGAGLAWMVAKPASAR